jgi:Tol biopolymer transport system component
VKAALARSIAVSVALSVAACGAPHRQEPEPASPPPRDAGTAGDLREPRLRNIRQLTFAGENAEAYFAADGKSLIFQSTRGGLPCDQIFVMDLETNDVRMVSTGKGKTTCSYFFPDGERILYSSTHEQSPDCPPPPDYSKGYVWKLYPGYEIFTATASGGDVRRITDHAGYDAEATVSPDGERIIFTSLRDGDLDLYTMAPDGGDVVRITNEVGYDGGAFFSPDGQRIVWRASRPKTEQEIDDYRRLLEDSAIVPMNLEIFVADAGGGHARQVTSNGRANFAPYFFPDGRRIIFASNVAAGSRSRNFDLWIVNDDGTGLEQVTFHPEFDGFPMFSPDGRYLVFASNRDAAVEGETNLFLAEWVETK